ncbi:hypothetical protein [Sphingomonas sp. LM7]|uniref:hypothetical protein n=1 Tax=Sphingomonas sp. LM7 TaxID=1938607 RepID=UPI0015C52EAC|nr:hypothetical protein [Sphingomonas sp. LM7]
MLRNICIPLAAILGLGALANGIFMLASPTGWYFAVPGVTTTGPFNQHFIRDIGIIFLFLGAAFLTGAIRREFRIVLWGAATLWLGCHALFHFWEVAVGICGTSALLRDFPAVTFPALLGAALTFWAVADARFRSTQGETK